MRSIAEIASTIDCNNSAPPLGNEAVKSVRGMHTLFKKQKHDHLLADSDGRVDAQFIEKLENIIIKNTPLIYTSSDKKIITYFNSIQMWGGITGRNIYVKGGGLSENINPSNYRHLAQRCESAQSIDEVFEAVDIFNRNTRNIGMAFITKHVRFLTSVNPHTGALPIYDSIIAKGVYGRRHVTSRDVAPYWHEIVHTSRSKQCSATDLERHIFNTLRTEMA